MIQDAWHSSLQKATLPTDLKVTWEQRQIPSANSGIQKRLEQAGQSLMKGYHTVLTSDGFAAITTELDHLDSELRGFAYEGVGMGLAQQDFMARRQNNPAERLSSFTQGAGADYKNMVYVGLGLMLARLERPILSAVSGLTEEQSWLILDGYGYYQGMFHWRDSLDKQATPLSPTSYLQQVFDQGLGRSIWFVDGGDAEHIAGTIGSFTSARQSDLWGGVGYACAYAGGVESEAIEALGEKSGLHQAQLAQGIAFAAYSRQQLGNQSVYTERACQAIWEKQADEVAVSALDNPDIETSATDDWQHYRARLLTTVTEVYSTSGAYHAG